MLRAGLGSEHCSLVQQDERAPGHVACWPRQQGSSAEQPCGSALLPCSTSAAQQQPAARSTPSQLALRGYGPHGNCGPLAGASRETPRGPAGSSAAAESRQPQSMLTSSAGRSGLCCGRARPPLSRPPRAFGRRARRLPGTHLLLLRIDLRGEARMRAVQAPAPRARPGRPGRPGYRPVLRAHGARSRAGPQLR